MRMLLSMLFVWHLTAITLGNLKSPDADRPPQRPRAISPSALAQGLDAMARGVEALHRLVWQATAPVRPAIDFYVDLTGLAQPWNMFSNPARYDEYLRVRYYIGADRARPRRMVTELVMPAGREDRVRLLGGYRDSYEDKAYAIALERFYRKRTPDLITPGTRPEHLPNDLAPIGRYFAKEYAARGLSPSERILRIELWRGTVLTPPPFQQPDEAQRIARQAVLLEYYQGPVDVRFNVPLIPPYHAIDREGGIEWLLEYFEEP